MVEYLLDLPCDCIESRESRDYGNTPLIRAASEGSLQVLKLLLERGANLYAESNYGYTAVHSAAYLGQIDIVKYLFENYPKLRKELSAVSSPLQLAISNNQTVVSQYLQELFDGTIQ